MSNRRTTSGAAIALGITALLAACSSPVPQPTPTITTVPATDPATNTPTPGPTPTVDPTTAAAEAAILDAYRSYWAAQVKVLRDPAPYSDLAYSDWGAVQHVAVDKALANLVATVDLYAENGIANVGAPVLTPVVSGVVPDQSATIADCVDATNWRPIYVATGKSAAAPGQAPRVVINSTVLFYDGHWVVNGSVADRAKTC
jgi:hypothetical protein